MINDYMRKRMGLKLGTVVNEPKEKRAIKPISDKKAAQMKEEKAQMKAEGETETPLQKWYADKITRLTGKCIRCGQKYNKNNPKLAIAAVAHCLAKRETMFPSVALHRENWIELSATCNCHNWFDNQATWEEIALSPIWPIVLEKFLIMEPHIKERERIPEVLFQEIQPKI
jgi:hypothetical protein